jgi:anaerobic ribonucleoside-triphosphate reductase activating protein
MISHDPRRTAVRPRRDSTGRSPARQRHEKIAPMPLALRVAARVRKTTAEGPFPRYALWVQGCSLRCPGCCNPELFSRDGGALYDVTALARDIGDAAERLGIEGLSVLGGEPLDQLSAVAALCQAVAGRGIGVIVFTGYSWAEARAQPGFRALWASVDTLVDGRFDARDLEPAGGRRFLGSRNQQIWHRTARYEDPGLWRGDNHAELRIGADGTVSVHGFPPAARRLARALARG